MLRLTVERKKRGWSQAELARRTGLHPSLISNLEAGRAHPWPKYRRVLAKVLQVKAELLFQPVEVVDDENSGRTAQ
jgi:hypothetical protein